MTNITLTCSTIGEYSGMSPQAQSKIYSKLPASWNCRIQGWLLRLHKSRKKEKKSITKTQQRLYSPEKFKMPPKIQIFFYRFTIDSLLSGSITSYCVSCTTEDLHKVWWTEWITEVILPSMQDNHTRQSKTKAKKIITDPCHPNNSFFSLLQSEKPCKSLGSIPRGSGAAPTPKLSRHLMRTLPGACSTNNTAETFIMHIWSLSHIHIAIMVSQI